MCGAPGLRKPDGVEDRTQGALFLEVAQIIRREFGVNLLTSIDERFVDVVRSPPMPRHNWTREELILAFNLYCKIPFGKIHYRNPEIIDLAMVIGRTPSAVSWKLANFARLDPSLKSRRI